MSTKLWIGLEGMEFYAHHGVYEEERIKGGKFLVDVMVYVDATEAILHDDLNGTINYEHIFAVVSKNMQEPVKLIEHLAGNIIKDIRLMIAEEDKIRIKIKKLKPPIDGEVFSSVVEMEA